MKQRMIREPMDLSGTVADVLAKGLVRHGVSVIFGQSLPTALHLAARRLDIRQAWYRTENAGGAMADGFARISHRVGVVSAQNGPAATLLVPPLGEALKSSIPVVALIQDVALTQTDRNAFQEFDHISMFNACAKWVRRLDQPSRAEDYLDMAFRAAAGGRPGPAVLLLPADVLIAPARTGLVQRSQDLGCYPLTRTMPARSEIEKAADMIASASRPIVIAGGGVHLSDACEALARLQETANLPVATTVMGKGSVDEQHPLSVGVVGYFMGTGSATKFQRDLVTNADLVLLVGNRTSQNDTDSWSLYPTGARYIHIDADPMELGRNYEALPLPGDAQLILDEMVKILKIRDLSKRKSTRHVLEQRIEQGRIEHQNEIEQFSFALQNPIRPEHVLAEIDRRLTPQTIVVADASYSSIWLANYLQSRKAGMRFLTPRGLAGLGWGLPMAIGAKIAAPEAPVVCIVGDGGFGHCWSEMEVAKRMNLDLTLVVLNNSILGYQKHAEDIKFGHHTNAVDMSAVDHVKISEACGCKGIRVQTPDQVAPVLVKAFQEKGLVLVDIIIDPEAHPPITNFEMAGV